MSELLQIEVDFRNQCHRNARRETGNGGTHLSSPSKARLQSLFLPPEPAAAP